MSGFHVDGVCAVGCDRPKVLAVMEAVKATLDAAGLQCSEVEVDTSKLGLPGAEVSYHHVLELPLEVVPSLHREALLFSGELPRSLYLALETLRLLCACSPLLSTSLHPVWPHVRELLQHLDPVFVRGLDAEAEFFVDNRSRVDGSHD